MNPKTLPISYGLGQRVKLTSESFARIENASRSIHAFPCSSFVEKIRPFIGQTAKVVYTHPPGYDVTISFLKGPSFQVRCDWVEPCGLRYVQERIGSAHAAILVFDETRVEFERIPDPTPERVWDTLAGLVERWNAQQPDVWRYTLIDPRPEKKPAKLVSVRVKMEVEKYSYSTNVNGDVSDIEIRKYFVNARFNLGSDERELILRCVSVEIDRK